MRIFLAGEHNVKNGNLADWKGLSILESFYYCRNNKWVPKLLKHINRDYFMLDSGAFTFINNSNVTVDWDRYVEEYAEYIVTHDIKLFIDLDIDVVVSLKEVERLREKLERLTGRKSVPVWHRPRGKQYYLDMCKEYDYIAIGGIAKSPEIPVKDYKYFPWFIKKAHENNCKVHALGYTILKNLEFHKFDSVDSAAWIYGNMGGYIYKFDGKTMTKIKKPEGYKMKSREVAMHNFREWVKFSKYMEGA